MMHQKAQNPSLTAVKTLHETSAPLVWAVTGRRAGENSQVLALAEALAWPFETKRLAYRKRGVVASLLRLGTLAGIDLDRSSPLDSPWPDLIISAGFRNEPVCRWIRKQSGERSRLVHIGRPWAYLDRFDLVITTPQYRLPERPNVLQNHTTLHRVSAAALAEAKEKWASRFSSLPRPFVAVVVGGNSGPYTLGPKSAARLGREASAFAAQLGGCLLVTTSARSPRRAVDALEREIRVPAEFFRWTSGAAENPYLGFLALADHIIVTGDSIAMLSEACATGKPVYIFDLGTGYHSMSGSGVAGREPSQGAGGIDFRIGAAIYRKTMQFGPQRLTRDLRLVHEWLVAQGHASWLSQAPPETTMPPQDLQRAVARVRKLMRDRGRIPP